jgi:hypothetical protein
MFSHAPPTDEVLVRLPRRLVHGPPRLAGVQDRLTGAGLVGVPDRQARRFAGEVGRLDQLFFEFRPPQELGVGLGGQEFGKLVDLAGTGFLKDIVELADEFGPLGGKMIEGPGHGPPA